MKMATSLTGQLWTNSVSLAATGCHQTYRLSSSRGQETLQCTLALAEVRSGDLAANRQADQVIRINNIAYVSDRNMNYALYLYKHYLFFFFFPPYQNPFEIMTPLKERKKIKHETGQFQGPLQKASRETYIQTFLHSRSTRTMYLLLCCNKNQGKLLLAFACFSVSL